MARFVKGDVVVVPFPFSAAPGSKRRPALVLASWAFGSSNDYLLCLISTQTVPDPYCLALEPDDIEYGVLHRASYVRPAYLFTADEALIVRKFGQLRAEKLARVLQTLNDVLFST
jgi:mRNA interferase MazF